LVSADKVKKVIFCSGQVYYDIDAARIKDARNDIAVVRVEELSPFPFKSVQKEIAKYSNAQV
jgi:2-oxoglutarate dehydrogenase E1 component